MTLHETSTSLLSGGALLVSFAALGFSIYVFRATSKLRRLQIDQLEQAISKTKTADVRVNLEARPKNMCALVINIVGQAPARNVQLEFEPADGRENSFPLRESELKLPVKKLMPESSTELLGYMPLHASTRYECKWVWENDDGTHKEESHLVSLR